MKLLQACKLADSSAQLSRLHPQAVTVPKLQLRQALQLGHLLQHQLCHFTLNVVYL
jgi:hypothetical protein